jgi:hypothetical protein
MGRIASLAATPFSKFDGDFDLGRLGRFRNRNDMI